MKRLPIGITADVHLDEHAAFAEDEHGYNSRLMWSVRVVLHMAKCVQKAGGKHLLVVGDWFHNRSKVTVHTLHQSERVLKLCKEMYGIGVILAGPGNHDYSLDGLSLSVKGQPFERIWETPGVYQIDGWDICVVPWTDDPSVVQHTLEAFTKYNFAVGHFGVSCSQVGPSDFEIPGHITADDLLPLKKRPMFLGHYHKPQDIPGTNARYIGSPLPVTWGEPNQKKRFIIMSEDGPESIPLEDFPRFIRTTPEKFGKCRDIDWVEIVTPKGQARRTKSLVAQKKSKAHVIVEAEIKDVAPRMDLVGLSLQKQIETYMDSVPPPKGVKPSVAKQAALALLQ